MVRTTAWALPVMVGFFGCGSRSQADADAEFPQSTRVMSDADLEGPDRPAPPRGSLWRDDVTATVDAGLGWFLQRVEVEPRLEDGRFRGFEIRDLRPTDYWRGVDLRPGDVVTSVNGKPIERETQAYDAFQTLKTSSELRVRYLRNGRERELVYRIVDPPSGADGKKKPSG